MLIAEVARISGLSKDGVRHYEELGLIRSSPRPAGSRTYREYEPEVIETIEKIRQAQQLGFSLKEVGPILASYRENPPTRDETIAFLEERLRVIRSRLQSLTKIETFIATKLVSYREKGEPGSSL